MNQGRLISLAGVADSALQQQPGVSVKPSEPVSDSLSTSSDESTSAELAHLKQSNAALTAMLEQAALALLDEKQALAKEKAKSKKLEQVALAALKECEKAMEVQASEIAQGAIAEIDKLGAEE